MAMGPRKQREKQEDIWIAHTELASAPGHPFYQRLNELLEAEGFDEFVEGRCAQFYAAKYGRPSLTPIAKRRSAEARAAGSSRPTAWAYYPPLELGQAAVLLWRRDVFLVQARTPQIEDAGRCGPAGSQLRRFSISVIHPG